MYAVVDIEATGGNHIKGKINEIAVRTTTATHENAEANVEGIQKILTMRNRKQELHQFYLEESIMVILLSSFMRNHNNF